jgi:hypothetical protein
MRLCDVEFLQGRKPSHRPWASSMHTFDKISIRLSTRYDFIANQGICPLYSRSTATALSTMSCAICFRKRV